MNLDELLPAARSIEAIPVAGEDGQPQFVLHDQTGLSDSTLAISLPGYFVLAHLDGEHTVADVQTSFSRQFRAQLPLEQIERLIDVLDRALLLDNERSATAYWTAREAYVRSSARDNRERWPAFAELLGEIEPLLSGPTSHAGAAVQGIIAPHLDYGRGGPCYREAYAALAAAPAAERYVILGTNHFGRSAAAVATTKTFRTPLGDVPVEAEFLAGVEQRLGASLCEHEFDHHREHSIELQVHLLQALHRERPFCIVPILCPDPCGASGTRPADGSGPDLSEVCDAVRAEVDASGDRTVIIASADLSHIGQRFGDADRTTADFMEQIGRSDQEHLALLEAREDEDFVASVAATNNQTRICSVGCMYALARMLPNRSIRVLRYHQALDWESDTHVTCCAAVAY